MSKQAPLPTKGACFAFCYARLTAFTSQDFDVIGCTTVDYLYRRKTRVFTFRSLSYCKNARFKQPFVKIVDGYPPSCRLVGEGDIHHIATFWDARNESEKQPARRNKPVRQEIRDERIKISGKSYIFAKEYPP